MELTDHILPLLTPFLPSSYSAIELKPRYARAWLNLGISFNNLGRYPDAVSAYCTALSLSPGAVHVWSYLRMSLRAMGRLDLVDRADQRDLAAFSREFDFQVMQ